MACWKFHQESPAHQRVARNRDRSLHCGGKLARTAAGRVMPIFIGFQPSSGAAQTRALLIRMEVGRAFTRLNDTAHTHSRPESAVPICRDRHSFATAMWPSRAPDIGPTEQPNERPRESRRLSAAKELGSCWRFFPTYADLQTSPVLRHPLLACVTTNVRSDRCRPAFWRNAAASNGGFDQALR